MQLLKLLLSSSNPISFHLPIFTFWCFILNICIFDLEEGEDKTTSFISAFIVIQIHHKFYTSIGSLPMGLIWGRREILCCGSMLREVLSARGGCVRKLCRKPWSWAWEDAVQPLQMQSSVHRKPWSSCGEEKCFMILLFTCLFQVCWYWGAV